MSFLLLALGPVLAIFFFFWAKDKYEREPLKRLILTAGIGAASAIPVVIVEMLWGHTMMDVSALSLPELGFMAFVEIGVTEELFKSVAFFSTVYWSKYMNEPYDGMIYSVAAALGFAAVENILYVISGGIVTALVRAITAVPAHAVFGAFIGYFAGRAKFTKYPVLKPFLILAGFAISVFLHGLYDLIALWPEPLAWLWLVPLLGVMIVITLILVKDARRRSPFLPEVNAEGHYTGYTVTGQPLTPKMMAMLEKESSRRRKYPDVSGQKEEPHFDNRPHFIDEYLKPTGKDDKPREEDIKTQETKEPEPRENKPHFLEDYFKK